MQSSIMHLSSQEKKWLHKAADAYGEKVNQLDNAWIKNGEDAIKASVNRMVCSI